MFAGNKLTIIVPTDNPAGLTSPADLAKTGLKVIAAGDEVPITKYATQLVDNLAKEPGYPADFAAAYAANVVSKEDNVKAIVAKIELGEGDAGIVYVTDATASDKVATVEVPDGANVPATYAGVVVKASPNQEAATAFLDWFAGAGRPGDPRAARVPAAQPNDRDRTRRGRRRPRRRPTISRHGRMAGDRALIALAGLFALFLGLPVVDPRRRGRSLDGSLVDSPSRTPSRPRPRSR